MKDRFKVFCMKIAAFSFRCLAFGFGHVYIHVKGEFDEEARAILPNHTAFVDPYIIVWLKSVSCVMKKELSEIGFMKHVFENVTPVYVDRSVQSGASKLIAEHMLRQDTLPILIYPEGTITNGDILLDFHHSAFLTEKKVQPITVRYWMFLVPKGWNSYAWTTKNTIEHFFLLFSMPPSIISIHVLPAISRDVEGEGDIKKFAKKAQLMMANDLKVRACLRNSNEIFRKIKAKKEANQEKKEENNKENKEGTEAKEESKKDK